MRFLIDGYNLMYALGLVRKHGGRAAWDGARVNLLHWLADRFGPAARDVLVIFDSQNSVGGFIEESHRGLRVLRDRGRTADEVIEDLVANEPAPETLTVVSNDARVRGAAARQGCAFQKCGEFVDQVMNQTRSGSEPRSPEKDESATPDEMAAWQRAFGG
jgi:uncharacterized protein